MSTDLQIHQIWKQICQKVQELPPCRGRSRRIAHFDRKQLAQNGDANRDFEKGSRRLIQKASRYAISGPLSLLEGKLKTASLTIEQLMNQRREEEKGFKENWNYDDRDITSVMKGLADMGKSKKAKCVTKKKAL